MSTDRTNEAWSHQQAELASLRAENARLAASVTELSAAGALLSMGQPWPLRDIIAKLIEATEHLLDDHACDTDGHEQFRGCANRAKELLPIIDRALSQPPSSAWTSENARLKSDVARLDEKLKEVEARESAARDMFSSLERGQDMLVSERDESQEAVSQIYFIIFGRAAEWSNLFGTDAALEEMTDAVNALKTALATEQARTKELSEQVAKLKVERDGALHSSECWELLHAKLHEQVAALTAQLYDGSMQFARMSELEAKVAALTKELSDTHKHYNRDII